MNETICKQQARRTAPGNDKVKMVVHVLKVVQSPCADKRGKPSAPGTVWDLFMRRDWKDYTMCALCGDFPLLLGDCAICPSCIEELQKMPGPFAVTLPGSEIPCYGAVEYAGIAKRAIEVVKITGNKRLAVDLGRILLSPLVADSIALTTEEGLFLVPVPASRSGRRRRGFDQVQMIASALSLPQSHLLRRKAGSQQKRLTRAGRLTNAAEKYMLVRDAPVIGEKDCEKRGVIIDDVATTGASISQCAALVRDAGFTVIGAFVCMVKR